jgi:enamine deaminase RidA (YjgF/YER057c/UK114 family)
MSAPRDEMVSRAARFLADPRVKDQTADAKAKFLRDKGVTDEEIELAVKRVEQESEERAEVRRFEGGVAQANGALYVSGQTAPALAQALAAVEGILKERGSSASKVIQATIFTPDGVDGAATRSSIKTWVGGDAAVTVVPTPVKSDYVVQVVAAVRR